MIELYAITADPAPPLPEAGSLRAVTHAGLAAVYAPAAGEGAVTSEALWRHEEIVEALMADRDVLPVRYGTRLEDPVAAEAVLRERRDELAAALERVRGAVEVSVRAVAPEAEIPRPDPQMAGADYLRARVGAAAVHEDAVRELHEPLAGLARSAITRPPRPSEVLRAAYLVDRDAVERFTSAVARLERAHPDHRLLCTGPWPPYSFTGA